MPKIVTVAVLAEDPEERQYQAALDGALIPEFYSYAAAMTEPQVIDAVKLDLSGKGYDV